jgi:hypothetical protein
MRQLLVGGSAQAGGSGGGSLASQIRPHAARNIQKRQKKGGFLLFLALKLLKMPFFAQKYLNRVVFFRNTSILKFVIT